MTKTLKLTLKAQPFEVMHTFEKCIEYRKPSEWIKSRLYNKDGTMKEYDHVEFINGYGSTRPRFTAYYCGFNICQQETNVTYSNGLEVKVEQGDFMICYLKIQSYQDYLSKKRKEIINNFINNFITEITQTVIK